MNLQLSEENSLTLVALLGSWFLMHPGTPFDVQCIEKLCFPGQNWPLPGESKGSYPGHGLNFISKKNKLLSPEAAPGYFQEKQQLCLGLFSSFPASPTKNGEMKKMHIPYKENIMWQGRKKLLCRVSIILIFSHFLIGFSCPVGWFCMCLFHQTTHFGVYWKALTLQRC